MKVREVLRLLLDDGWFVVTTRGSHIQLKHATKPGRVTLAGHPGDDLAPGTLGEVVDSSTGFRLPGGNVRLPDVSFVAKGRVPEGQRQEGFAPFAPDLAVEVLSPDDRPREVLDKVGEYLQAGVRLVWVIDWKRRRAAVYRSLTDVHVLGPEDVLDGADVVPGFRCRLADVIG